MTSPAIDLAISQAICLGNIDKAVALVMRAIDVTSGDVASVYWDDKEALWLHGTPASRAYLMNQYVATEAMFAA